jgi:5-methylthioadenosine/S-adenosylhomocysteine deaminase
MTKTLLRGGTVIAYADGAHRRLEDGAIVVEGDRIAFVGRRWDGAADRTIELRGKLVIPGQISTHAHVGLQEGSRLLVDGGRREFIRSGFLHFLPARRSGGPGFLAEQDARASLRFGFAALLRHGVTTVLAFAPAGDDGGAMMVEIAGEMGLRLYWAPLATGGRYWTEDDGKLSHEMDERAGMAMLDHAAGFIERHQGANDGRLRGVVTLDEFFASTPALRRRAKELARSLSVPLTMHFIEQHREFFETMARTGRTPVQLLAEEEVLGPDTILAHCIYVGSHSLVGYPLVDDIGLLGQSRTVVAHSPVAFSRRGVALESFDRYRRAGVTLALATDAYPLDLFAEMRIASIMGKVADRNHEAAPADAVFAASNLEGARALGRDDLGRIAPGAKADLVVVDTANLTHGPNPDPVRALVHLAAPGMVDLVMVDGRILLEGKRLLVCDEDELFASGARSSERVWRAHAAYDYAGRPAAEAFPPSLSEWKG